MNTSHTGLEQLKYKLTFCKMDFLDLNCCIFWSWPSLIHRPSLMICVSVMEHSPCRLMSKNLLWSLVCGPDWLTNYIHIEVQRSLPSFHCFTSDQVTVELGILKNPPASPFTTLHVCTHILFCIVVDRVERVSLGHHLEWKTLIERFGDQRISCLKADHPHDLEINSCVWRPILKPVTNNH